jgi:hypothetical protein
MFWRNIMRLPWLLCPLFDSENGGNTFLRNVGNVPDYTISHPRRYRPLLSNHLLSLTKFVAVETTLTKYMLVHFWTKNIHASICITLSNKELQSIVDSEKPSNSVFSTVSECANFGMRRLQSPYKKSEIDWQGFLGLFEREISICLWSNKQFSFHYYGHCCTAGLSSSQKLAIRFCRPTFRKNIYFDLQRRRVSQARITLCLLAIGFLLGLHFDSFFNPEERGDKNMTSLDIW